MDTSIREKIKLRNYLFSQSTEVYFSKNSFDLENIEFLAVARMALHQAYWIVEYCKGLKKLKVKYISEQGFYEIFKVLGNLFFLEEIQLNYQCYKTLSPQDSLIYLSKLKRLTFDFYSHENYNWQSIKSLPQLESLGGVAHLSRNLVNCLKQLKHLKELKFFRIDKDDNNNRYCMTQIFTALPNLISVDLYHSGLDNEHFKELIKANSNLKHLSLSFTKVTSKGLACLTACKSLQSLQIHNTGDVSEQGSSFIIENLTQLKRLGIRLCQQTIDSLESVSKRHKSLETLIFKLGRIEDTKKWNNLFKNMKQLRHLEILESEMNKQMVFGIVKNLQLLETLILDNTVSICGISFYEELGDSVCYYVSKLRHLKKFRLAVNSIGYGGAMKVLRNTISINSRFGDSNLDRKFRRNARMMEFRRHGTITKK